MKNLKLPDVTRSSIRARPTATLAAHREFDLLLSSMVTAPVSGSNVPVDVFRQLSFAAVAKV